MICCWYDTHLTFLYGWPVMHSRLWQMQFFHTSCLMGMNIQWAMPPNLYTGWVLVCTGRDRGCCCDYEISHGVKSSNLQQITVQLKSLGPRIGVWPSAAAWLQSNGCHYKNRIYNKGENIPHVNTLADLQTLLSLPLNVSGIQHVW